MEEKEPKTVTIPKPTNPNALRLLTVLAAVVYASPDVERPINEIFEEEE